MNQLFFLLNTNKEFCLGWVYTNSKFTYKATMNTMLDIIHFLKLDMYGLQKIAMRIIHPRWYRYPKIQSQAHELSPNFAVNWCVI
jgi:hypothetical protein